MTYPGKNKHKGRYFVKKRLSKYKRRQQGCLIIQREIMDKENHSRSNHVEKDYDNRQVGNTRGNQKE